MPVAQERRQFRRSEVDAAVSIHSLEQEESAASPILGQAKNVSLAGLYCTIKAPCALKPGEQVSCSLSIPPEQTRSFPFLRLMGRGWVVRLEPVSAGRRAGESQSQEHLLGLAVAFAPDVTALGAI